MTIWQAVKELIKKVLPSNSIANTINVSNAISNEMENAIRLWSDMYAGKPPWVREPDFNDPTRIVSLGLPSLIASEKARLATIEMESEITPITKEVEKENPDYVPPSIDDMGNAHMGRGQALIKEDVPDGPTERADFLNEQYKKVKKNLRRQVEYGIAKGGLVIKPYIVIYDESKLGKSATDTENATERNESESNESEEITSKDKKNKNKELPPAEIEFDFVQADRFKPIAFDGNGKILEAAFIQTIFRNDKVYVRLEHHKLEGRKATVQNFAFVNKNTNFMRVADINITTDLGTPVPLTEVPEWANLQPVTTIEPVDRLLFAYFKMPEANTIDTYSPLGVSCYSRVVDLIKDADMQYSRLLWEFEGGELAVDVDRDALKLVQDSAGHNRTVLPQKQQRLFRKIDLNSEETYNVFSPQLRDESLVNGLNTILTRIEDATGLSRGTISDITSVEAKTATELKILKQRSFATNSDIQQALEEALRDTVYAMNAYCDLYEVTPDGDYDISFEWDDSILIDSDAELDKRLKLMSNGLASKVENRMWYFGETENQAKEALQKIADENKAAIETNMLAQSQLGEIAQKTDKDGNPLDGPMNNKNAQMQKNINNARSKNDVKQAKANVEKM